MAKILYPTKVNSSVADGLTLAKLALAWSICQSEVGCRIISFESLGCEIEAAFLGKKCDFLTLEYLFEKI